MATSANTNNSATTATPTPAEATAEAGDEAAKPPLEVNDKINNNDARVVDSSLSNPQLNHIRAPHTRSSSSLSIPLPDRDDKTIHHRPMHGTGAEVYGSSDTEGSTAPNSPRAADFETRAVIRAAKEEMPIGFSEPSPAGADWSSVPPTSGHAITAAKLFGHRFFAEVGDSISVSTSGTMGPTSNMATPGGSEPMSSSEMSGQNCAMGSKPEILLAAASLGGVETAMRSGPAAPLPANSALEGRLEGQSAATKASPRRLTVSKADGSNVATLKALGAGSGDARPPTNERKSMFGKLFDKKDGKPQNAADSGTDSDGGVVTMKQMIGRKPSGKKHYANGDMTPIDANGGAFMVRQPSGGVASTSSKPALGRAPSEKGTGDDKGANHKFRDMVGMAAPKLGLKPSSSKGGRSDDGKSEEGETRSRAGSQATASLLKKYGVCEKAAIGKGATAVVRLAHKWDRGTDKLYAVKEFRKRRKGESEKEYVKKLTSEFCISSTLHHVNVVETVDLVQDDSHHWCEVMEYCPGGDLYAAIKRGAMSQAEINSYFKQMLLGVEYLHSMGVAHRDIKPENLLLDGKGRVKITDFGVSDVFRMCWEKTTHMSKGLCGSEPYLPREMFERKEYDARLVDVWACAVVYYCCCMQELPWRVAKPTDPSFSIFLQSYRQTSPIPLTNLQRESRSMIKRMLAPDPENRIQMNDIMTDLWVKGLEVIEVSIPLMTVRERI